MSTAVQVVVADTTLPDIAKFIDELFINLLEIVKPPGIVFNKTVISTSNTEICKSIAAGKFHFGIGDFSMTAERLRSLDWTAPFQTSHLVIITRVSETWNHGVFFQPFTSRLWGVIVVTVAMVTAVLLWLERDHIYRRSGSDIAAGVSPDSQQGAGPQLELLPGVQQGALHGAQSRRGSNGAPPEAEMHGGAELQRAQSLRGSGRIRPEPEIRPGAQPGAGPQQDIQLDVQPGGLPGAQPEAQPNADPGAGIQPDVQPGASPQLGSQPGAPTLTPTRRDPDAEIQSLVQPGVHQGQRVRRRSERKGPLSLGLGRILWWVHHSILYAHDKNYVKTFLGRVVAGIWLANVLIMLTAYQAGLQATFTTSQLVPRFQSVGDVLYMSSGKVGMQKGTWYNEQHLSLRITADRVQDLTLDLGEWDKLLQSGSVEAILAEYPYAALFVKKYGCDKYAISGLQEHKGQFAWGGWGWPFLIDERLGPGLGANVSLQALRRNISAAILELQVKGVMETLQKSWMGHSDCDSRMSKNQIDIGDVQYLLLSLGVVTAIVFFVSILYEQGAFSLPLAYVNRRRIRRRASE